MAGVLQRKKGSECVAVVKSALADISKGQARKASAKLNKLRKDSACLAEEAEQLATRFQKIEAYYICQEEAIRKEIGELGCNELELTAQKSSEVAQLESNRAILQDNGSKLRSAEGELRDAEEKLKRAKKKKKKKKGMFGGLGVVVGFAVGGPIGAIVGAGAGVGAADTIGASYGITSAKERIRRHKNECQIARSAIADSEGKVSSIQTQISKLEERIGELKQKQLTCHGKVDEIKEWIVLLKKSIEFWQLFKQATQHGGNRTSLLKKIIDKANEKGDYRVLLSQGSKRVAKTFLEAWESIESLAIEGASSHLLELQFDCASCIGSYTGLPYVDEKGTLICFQCNRQQAIKK